MPIVGAWVEQRGDLLSGGVNARDVWSFGQIAATAAECKVAGCGRAAMLASDYVVDDVAKPVRLFGNSTVFAPAACPLPDFLFQILIHVEVASGGGVVPVERCAGLGVKNGQHVVGGEQILQVGSFVRCQRPVLRLG